jgi:hypothetical protein
MSSESLSEMYAFLGVYDGVRYYWHAIHNEEFIPAITHKLYGVLYEGGFVTARDTICVFEVMEESLDVVLFRHSGVVDGFEVGDLKRQYDTILSEEKDIDSGVRYTYSDGLYNHCGIVGHTFADIRSELCDDAEVVEITEVAVSENVPGEYAEK